MRLAQAQKQQLLKTISDAYEGSALASTQENSVYIPSARNIRDQHTQATRYKETLDGYAALQSPEEEHLGGVISGISDKISKTAEAIEQDQIRDTNAARSASDSVAVSIDSKVGRAGKTIGERLDYIASFSTAKSDIHGSVLGAEIKNTILTMAGQDNLGDALKTLLADCIPCDGRVTSGFEVDIAGNFKNQIESDIINRINYLKSMLKFTASKDVYRDLCSLVNALNFMCIPDLVRILSLLAFLLTKYTVKIGDATSMLMSLISALFQPILIDLRGLFDQYQQLVLGIIECVIDSLAQQAQKLNVKSDAPSALKDVSKLLNSSVKEVRDMVKEGKSFFEEKIDTLDEQVNAFFGQWFNSSFESSEFSSIKLKITRVMGLINALIQFKSLGNVCDGKNFSAEELSVFVNTYIAPSTRLKIAVDDDGIIVSDKDAGVLEGLMTDIMEIQTGVLESDQFALNARTTTGAAGAAGVSPAGGIAGAATSALEAGADISSIADQITIRFEDCLYGAEGASSEKVQKWINELTDA